MITENSKPVSEERRSRSGLLGAVSLVALLATPLSAMAEGVAGAPDVRAAIVAAPLSQDDGQISQSADPDTQADTVEEVMVIGSRIPRRDYVSESPVATTNSEAIESTGSVSLSAVFVQLPQFAPVDPRSSNATRVNLRALGANRSLVLLDGRRVVPSDQTGAVDVNIFPTSLVEGIEVITGGASSTYGSDAMSGVVNFRLARSFSGAELDVQTGWNERGDGRSSAVSLTVGDNFADGQGNAVLYASYSDRDPIVQSDRDFFDFRPSNNLQTAVFLLATTPASQAAVNSVFARYGVAAGVVSGATNIGVNRNGTLFTQSPGATRTLVNFQEPESDTLRVVGNAVRSYSDAGRTLQGELSRTSLFSRVRYDVAPNVELYAEGLFTSYESQAVGVPPPFITVGGISMPVTNPFIPADMRTLLASRANPNAPVLVNYSLPNAERRVARRNFYQFTAGLRGDLEVGGRTWSWDVYGSTGSTDETVRYVGSGNREAIERLLNAPDGGASLCAGGFDIFGFGRLSTACAEYAAQTVLETTSLEQSILEANIGGALLTLPAGDLQFALGASHRTNSYDYVPEVACTRSMCLGEAVLGAATGGDETVSEVFGELLVPVIRDVALVKELNLNLGYRLSEYGRSGQASAYKVAGDWSVIDSLRLRAGYSRAIRAPSLGEIYAPTSPYNIQIGNVSATTTTGDPCDIRSSFRRGANAAAVRAICLAQGVPSSVVDTLTLDQTLVRAFSRGNPNLEPEVADTKSVGIVLSSPSGHPLFSRLSGSIDWYDIEITGAIGQLPLSVSLLNCFNATGTNPTFDPASPWCSFINRDRGTGTIYDAETPLLNLASYHTSGIDFQVDWAVAFDQLNPNWGSGELQLNVAATYLQQFEVKTLEGQPVYDYAGFSQGVIATNVLPRWKTLTSLTYVQGPAQVGLRWRRVGEVEDVSKLTSPTSTVPGVAAHDYFDLTARWAVSETVSLRAGVNNVTDQEPPQVGPASSGNVTDIGTYDTLGRSMYVGLTARF